MRLELDDAEAEVLTQALESRLSELTHELACTEKHSLQHELALLVARLELVIERIEAARRSADLSGVPLS
jgi:hypothetical protein